MGNNIKLIITRPAYNDMGQIFEYIAKDNPFAAKKILDLFEEQFKRILMFPDSGFKLKYFSENIKMSVVAKHYQIIYTNKNDKLYILRILTGYQDIFNL